VAVVDPSAWKVTGRPDDAVARGFDAADLTWERAQEQAALAFVAGDPVGSSRFWAQGLEIAEKHFGRGDPRLATSLTNQGLVLRRRRQDYQASMMLHRALHEWDGSWRWIHLMTPGHPVAAAMQRGSDRLTVYDGDARAKFTALVERGRAITAALERYDELPAGGLQAWFVLKPKRMTDLRKLLAAVLLIAPRPHG
jgi:hypothetical protein